MHQLDGETLTKEQCLRQVINDPTDVNALVNAAVFLDENQGYEEADWYSRLSHAQEPLNARSCQAMASLHAGS
jgi:hypothetical protein